MLRNDKEIVIRSGGPIVKDYGSHFLRDDTEIRVGHMSPEDQVEGYSLFCVEPYGRVIVYGGNREWAIAQADEEVKRITECSSSK